MNGWAPPDHEEIEDDGYLPLRASFFIDRWYKVAIQILVSIGVTGCLAVFVGYVWWGVLTLVETIASR